MGSFAELFSSKQFVLVASLPANTALHAAAAMEGGADALKVHINVHHHASATSFGTLAEERENLQSILAAAKGRPVGIVPGDKPVIGAELVGALRDMGFSFISAYAHHLSPGALEVPGVDKMVAPDFSYQPAEIALLGQMPFQVLEASVIHPDGYGIRLSLRDILTYQAVAGQVDQAVLVPTQRAIAPHDVEALYRAGVRGVMIGAVVTGMTPEGVLASTKQFREAIDRLLQA